jgi:hypothetical protein
VPVSPDLAANLARETLAIYLDAEDRILAKVARRLARGINEPGWAEAKLLEVQQLRRESQAIMDAATGRSDAAIFAAVRAAYSRGMIVAGADIGARVTFGKTAEHAVAAIARATQERMVPARLRIVRFATDIYSAVLQQTAAAVTVGVDTRREASARMLTHLTSRGVTGFVDKVGRGWDLGSYTEMAVRTAAAQAAVQGHVDQLQAAGRDLVQVSNAPEECELCRPWEGKVLALSSASLGEPVAGQNGVRFTLAQAEAAGLFHPNCRHSVGAFIPGVTPPIYDTADPKGNALRVHQRAYERRIRELKRRQTVQLPLDPRAARLTGAKLRAKQAEFKAWREANGRKNLAYRTQVRKPQPVTHLTPPTPSAPATATLPGPRTTGQVPASRRGPARTPRVVDPPPIVELDPELAGYTDKELAALLEDASASDDPTAGEFIAQASRELELRASTQRVLVDADRDAEAWKLGHAAQLAQRPARKLAEQAKHEFDEFVYRAFLDAEAATNGNLVRRSALAEFNAKYGSVDVLFSGRVDIAYRYASEELLRWWETNPRLTLAEFKVQLGATDQTSVTAAGRAAKARQDAALRAEENYDPARAAERRKARARELRRRRG